MRNSILYSYTIEKTPKKRVEIHKIYKRFVQGPRNLKPSNTTPGVNKPLESTHSQSQTNHGLDSSLVKKATTEAFLPKEQSPTKTADVPWIKISSSQSQPYVNVSKQINETKTKVDQACNHQKVSETTKYLQQQSQIPGSPVQPFFSNNQSRGLLSATYYNVTAAKMFKNSSSDKQNPLGDMDGISDEITVFETLPKIPLLEEKSRDQSQIQTDLKKDQKQTNDDIYKKLEERFLFHVDRQVITKQFLKYYNIIKEKETKIIDISNKNFENPVFSLGLLIPNPSETVILSGIQTHVILIYTVIEGQKFVTGYLTSDKDKNNFKLSDTQPFPKDPDGKPATTPQYFRLTKPYLIEEKNLEPLPKETQEAGEKYLQQKAVQECLKQIHEKHIFPELNKPIIIYDGKGITAEDIQKVFDEQDKDAQSKVKKYFDQYKMLKTNGNMEKFEEKMNNLKKTDIVTYNYVKTYIENYEKK